MLSEDVLRYNMPMHILCRPHPPCHTVDIYWNYLLAISYTIISYLINASVIYRKAGRQSHGFVQMIRAAQDTKAIPSVQRKPITWWQPQGQGRLWR